MLVSNPDLAMPRLALPHQTEPDRTRPRLPRQAWPGRSLPFLAGPRQTTPPQPHQLGRACHALPHPATPGLAKPYQNLLCLPYHAKAGLALPRLARPHCASLRRAMPHLAAPRPACLGLPCHLGHALPHPMNYTLISGCCVAMTFSISSNTLVSSTKRPYLRRKRFISSSASDSICRRCPSSPRTSSMTR